MNSLKLLIIILLSTVSIHAGKPNLQEMKKILSSNDSEIREHLLSSIIIHPKKFSKDAPELISGFFVGEKSANCRRLMIDAISAMEPNQISSNMNETIVMALNDTDQYVRHSAISLIGALNQVPSNFIQKLVLAVSDSSKYVFECAQNTLIKLGEFSVHPLIEKLEKPTIDNETKRRIVYILKELGDDAKRAIPVLRKLRDDPDQTVSTSANQALRYLEM